MFAPTLRRLFGRQGVEVRRTLRVAMASVPEIIAPCPVIIFRSSSREQMIADTLARWS